MSQLKLIPQLGDTTSIKRNRLIWDACPNCGLERWQRHSRLGRLCPDCAQKIAQAKPETRLKKSKSLKGRVCWWSYKTGAKLKGRKHKTPKSIESRENHRKATIRQWADPIAREILINANRASKNTPESLEKSKQRQLAYWQDPVWKYKTVKSLLEMRSPNKAEVMVQQILDKNYPNEWQYVGDGTVILNGRSPDFINTNGHKWIIEYFGDYWHPEEDEQKKIDTYAKIGYKTLVIWSNKVHGKHDIERVIKEWVESNA